MTDIDRYRRSSIHAHLFEGKKKPEIADIYLKPIQSPRCSNFDAGKQFYIFIDGENKDTDVKRIRHASQGVFPIFSENLDLFKFY